MFIAIHPAFWVGMAVTAVVVLAGCIVAWVIPPRKEQKES